MTKVRNTSCVSVCVSGLFPRVQCRVLYKMGTNGHKELQGMRVELLFPPKRYPSHVFWENTIGCAGILPSSLACIDVPVTYGDGV